MNPRPCNRGVAVAKSSRRRAARAVLPTIIQSPNEVIGGRGTGLKEGRGQERRGEDGAGGQRPHKGKGTKWGQEASEPLSVLLQMSMAAVG